MRPAHTPLFNTFFSCLSSRIPVLEVFVAAARLCMPEASCENFVSTTLKQVTIVLLGGGSETCHMSFTET